jgi:protein-arginine kinase activator protein McsA
MLTSNFRELLAVKAKAYQNLELLKLVKSLSASTLEEYIIESLEKMARNSDHIGKNPNRSLMTFAKDIQNDDILMLKDALGHHISRYKSALKAFHAATDKDQRRKLRSVADQHVSRIVPLVHLAARVGRHSNGKLIEDTPPIRAWQANYTGHHKFKDFKPISVDAQGKVTVFDPVRNAIKGPGKPENELIGTEGWGGRPSASGRKPGHNHNNSRSTPDYRYLEMPKNKNHDKAWQTPHTGGFPFEDIRIGSEDEVAKGGGHLHIEDVPNVDSYVPHEFDYHPINSIFDIPDYKFTPEQEAKFSSDLGAWKNSHHYENFLNRHEALEAADPDAYARRGTSKPSEHHFEGVPLIKQPRHAILPHEVIEPSPEELANDHLISYIDPISPPQQSAEMPSSSRQAKSAPAKLAELEDIPYSPSSGAKANVVRRPAEIVPPPEQAPARPNVIRRPAEAVAPPEQAPAQASPTNIDKLPEKLKGTITQRDWENLPPLLRLKFLRS